MKRVKRNSDDPDLKIITNNTITNSSIFKDGGERKSLRVMMCVFTACLVVISVLFSVSVVFRDPVSDSGWGLAEAARVLNVNSDEENASRSSEVPGDKLVGGLLAPGFDESSCLSRYQSSLYRKGLLQQPSPYLTSRLRKYEALHNRCGPHTESYNKTLKQLKSGQQTGSSECNYVVWISFSGLGNRILTLASAFVYALLTNRVLLVDPGVDMPDLFCEPFPEVSWFVSPDFPLINQFKSFDQKSPHCYGNLVKDKKLETLNGTSSHSFVYLHLAHDYDEHNKLFFCDQDQNFLQKVPWLIMKTDNYFIPSLFLIPSFEQELGKLFPNKEMVFHFLGRYLFHPTNQVWGLITRYHDAYLAKADERIGIQIRVFDTGTQPFQYVLDQILACTMTQNLLPEISMHEPITSNLPEKNHHKSKAVLMTSLNSGYFEKIRDMYWEHSTVTGETIGIFQPSHEEHQQTGKKTHNRKAWAEMYLLSLTDVLVTSAWSTFGYVAQGLGGLKPWILYKPDNQTSPDPPCRRAMSMEPCFHSPPFYDCKAKTGVDTGKLVPHVRHCEDISWGLKLVDQYNDL